MAHNADRYRFMQYAIESVVNYLDAANLKDTARTLERESGLFFNVQYFTELFLNSDFKEAEKYLKGFISIHDSPYSALTFFEIRKQKLIFALQTGSKDRAVKFVLDDFKEFGPYGCSVPMDAADLIHLQDIRMHPMMQNYGNPVVERRIAMGHIQLYLEANPRLYGKLVFPNMAHLRAPGPSSSGTQTANYQLPNPLHFRLFNGLHAPFPPPQHNAAGEGGNEDDYDDVDDDDDDDGDSDEVLSDSSDSNGSGSPNPKSV